MASIRSCSLTRRALKSRYRDLACIAYVQRRRPMHWSMRQISQKFRNGSVTQTLPLREFMIGVKVVRKIPQHFGSPIRQKVRRWRTKWSYRYKDKYGNRKRPHSYMNFLYVPVGSFSYW